MSKFIDLTGQRFGRLTVVSRVENNIHNKIQWLCICSCGNKITVPRQRLRNGDTKSCGCLNTDQRRKKTPNAVAKTRIWGIWQGIKKRTGNPQFRHYERYGKRGINICDEWKTNFRNFQSWAIKNGYNDNLTIDRIDNDKGYSPDNCRWVSQKENTNNTSRNHYVALNGEIKTLSQWAEIYNMNKHTVYSRIAKGWNDVKAITTPVRKK